MAIGDKLRRASKAYFNGYRRLANPHQKCVDSPLSRHLMERPQLRPAVLERAQQLQAGATAWICQPNHAGPNKGLVVILSSCVLVIASPTTTLTAEHSPISPSRNALVEIDNLAPVGPGVDIADRAAFLASKMGADVVPIPLRQFVERQSRVMISARPAGPTQWTKIGLNPAAFAKVGVPSDQ